MLVFFFLWGFVKRFLEKWFRGDGFLEWLVVVRGLVISYGVDFFLGNVLGFYGVGRLLFRVEVFEFGFRFRS